MQTRTTLSENEISTIAKALVTRIENEIRQYNNSLPEFDQEKFKKTDKKYIALNKRLQDYYKFVKSLDESVNRFAKFIPSEVKEYPDYSRYTEDGPSTKEVKFKVEVKSKYEDVVKDKLRKLVYTAHDEFNIGQKRLEQLCSWDLQRLVESMLILKENIPNDLDILFAEIYETLVNNKTIRFSDDNEPMFSLVPDEMSNDQTPTAFVVEDSDEDEEDWDEIEDEDDTDEDYE